MKNNFDFINNKDSFFTNLVSKKSHNNYLDSKNIEHILELSRERVGQER